ncbi:MAG: hypothetical protein VYE67_04805, partial [Planctomycetota bacterium]|nr:hypothetical protein [Planctomycetota bacterium]
GASVGYPLAGSFQPNRLAGIVVFTTRIWCLAVYQVPSKLRESDLFILEIGFQRIDLPPL